MKQTFNGIWYIWETNSPINECQKLFSKSCRFESFYFLSGMSVFNFRMWIPHGYHRNTSKKGQGPEIYVRKECIEIFVLFNFFSDLNITLATIVRYTFSQMKNRPFNVNVLCYIRIDRSRIHTNISRCCIIII